MPRTGTVNYHISLPERQAFHIDAGGVVGEMIAPELVPTRIRVRDTRAGEATVVFDHDSVEFAEMPSRVTEFEGADWQADYERELTALLTGRLGAKEVVVFDHTVRADDPDATRKPARNVHSDYSPEGARKRLADLLGAERAETWATGHFAFINLWRPVGAPINSAPLGFVRPSTVREADWELIDLVYPDRRGHIMGLVADDRHEWVYRSKMTPEEIVFFNIYDNRGRPSIAHSAIDMVEDPTVTTVRKSIESRTLVRF